MADLLDFVRETFHDPNDPNSISRDEDIVEMLKKPTMPRGENGFLSWIDRERFVAASEIILLREKVKIAKKVLDI